MTAAGQSRMSRLKFSIAAIGCQTIFVVLLAIFGRYDANEAAASAGASGDDKGNSLDSMYSMFQDVHVMIFIGFGFLMTFLRWHAFSSVAHNLLIAGLVIQWALILNGLTHLDKGKFDINITGLLSADFACAAVLISFGAVLGRISPLQCLVLAMVEIPIFIGNEFVGLYKFHAADLGGSMFVHIFGAYFGLAVAWILGAKRDRDHPDEKSKYANDVFAMIGSIFLWLFWPSFNSVLATGNERHRAVINTYLSLAGSTIVSFAVSAIFEHGKFEMSHIQNAPLAGGVAVGTVADMLIQPFGAVLIGCAAGAVSVIGYAVLSPKLRSIGILDTCGVNNLHGMPGVISGVLGIVFSLVANLDVYGDSLYKVFPYRQPPSSDNITASPAATGRSAGVQAGMQAAALGVTIACAVVGGLLTGLLLKLKLFDQVEHEKFYDDSRHWQVPDDFKFDANKKTARSYVLEELDAMS